jgi:predicted transcriptional regulator
VTSRRSKSFLAAEAGLPYLERELEIIDGIRRGMADVEAGRVVADDQAMAEVQAVIDAAKEQGGSRPAITPPVQEG